MTPVAARPSRGQSAAGWAVLVAAVVAAVCFSVAGQGAFISAPPAGAPPSKHALRGSVDSSDANATSAAATAAGSRIGDGLGVLCLGVAAALFRSSNRKHGLRSRGITALKAEGEKKRLEDLKVGDKVTATVSRDAAIGVYMDIGAEKDALLPRNQVPKGKKYTKGDVIEDVTIFEVSTGDLPSERKIRVALGGVPASFKEGQKVKGKVESTTDFGVFFGIGGARSALCPTKMMGKDKEEYKKGQEVELTIVSIEGDKITVSDMAAVEVKEDRSKPKMAIASLKVGQEVQGTVATINEKFGVFFDIGAERTALCYTNQLDKGLAEYKVGDKVTGLKIYKADPDGMKVELTTRPFASSLKLGDKLEATVISVGKNGVFFDAGVAGDLLAPESMLGKPLSEYTRGEVADLIVVNVQGDRVMVSTKSEEEIGTPLARLVRGASVTAKVKRVDKMMGLFLDIGAEKDALWRLVGSGAATPPKPLEEYKVGEEVPGLIIMKVDVQSRQVEVGSPDSMPMPKAPTNSETSMSNLKVGATVSGTVISSSNFGVFVNIGSERDALYASSQLDKPASEYKKGDVLEGLKITEVDLDKRRLAVSMRKCASDYSIGEQVTGKVSKIMAFGFFVDIGASVDALLPLRLLAQEVGAYKAGQELPGLKISQLDEKNNKISVAQKDAVVDSAEPGGRFSMDDMEVGKKLTATVRATQEYGAFVNIGLGRKDALLPMAYLGPNKALADLKAGDQFEVYVAEIDRSSGRVTVSVIEITDEMRAKKTGGAGKPGKGAGGRQLPKGLVLPDPMRLFERAELELIGNTTVNIQTMEKKYPGLHKWPEKRDIRYFFAPTAHGHNGYKEVTPAQTAWIPIPVHLRKDDAGPAEIKQTLEDFNFMFGYETGIKPEIHTKFRQSPMNDPNWIQPAVSSDEPPAVIPVDEIWQMIPEWVPPVVKVKRVKEVKEVVVETKGKKKK